MIWQLYQKLFDIPEKEDWRPYHRGRQGRSYGEPHHWSPKEDPKEDPTEESDKNFINEDLREDPITEDPKEDPKEESIIENPREEPITDGPKEEPITRKKHYFFRDGDGKGRWWG